MKLGIFLYPFHGERDLFYMDYSPITLLHMSGLAAWKHIKQSTKASELFTTFFPINPFLAFCFYV